MTPGTSPPPPGTASIGWTGAGHRAVTEATPWLAKLTAIGYLAGLLIMVATAWHDPSASAAGLATGLPTWHLAFLMATGTGIALLTLAKTDTDAEPATSTEETETAPSAGVRDLMDQLSHELRTPLNAVIGFSEVMASELHGPLGNTRYQEYAQHISESGGRLLKSSAEALAVTEAMTALMTDRSGTKRERMIAATLVREAWRGAAGTEKDAPARLTLSACTTCDIMGERRPTVQALQHLLREAAEHVAAGGTVTVTGKRHGTRRSLEIKAHPSTPAAGPQRPAHAEGNRLSVILARLLLEMQGARLVVTPDLLGSWSALVVFPGQQRGQARRKG